MTICLRAFWKVGCLKTIFKLIEKPREKIENVLPTLQHFKNDIQNRRFYFNVLCQPELLKNNEKYLKKKKMNRKWIEGIFS